MDSVPESKTFTLRVRRFDEWKERTFEMSPSSTMDELMATIATAYNLKVNELRLTITQPTANFFLVYEITVKATIKEMLANQKLEDITLVVLPTMQATWHVKEDVIQVPITVRYKNLSLEGASTERKQVLASVKQNTTLREIFCSIDEGRYFVYSENYIGIQSIDLSKIGQTKFLYWWSRQGYDPIIITLGVGYEPYQHPFNSYLCAQRYASHSKWTSSEIL